MTQPAILPLGRPLSRQEKFAPAAQELRTRFARIKRELRRLQRLISRRPRQSAAPAGGA
jgi:hypothetical protein